MVVPATSNWTMDLDEALDEALSRCGQDRANGYDGRAVVRAFGLLCAEWSNYGVLDWMVEEGDMAVAANTASFAAPSDAVDILEAAYVTPEGQHRPLTRMGRTEYAEVADKAQSGVPTSFHVKRTRDAVSVVVWPVPAAAYTVRLWRTRRARDVGGLSANLDLPVRFYPAFVSGLAYFLSRHKRNVKASRRAELKAEYKEDLDTALLADRDRADLRVEFDLPGGWEM